MTPIYNRKEAARLLKKSVKTLYRWEQHGVLIPKRNKAKGAYYTPDQLNDFLNLPEEAQPARNPS